MNMLRLILWLPSGTNDAADEPSGRLEGRESVRMSQVSTHCRSANANRALPAATVTYCFPLTE